MSEKSGRPSGNSSSKGSKNNSKSGNRSGNKNANRNANSKRKAGAQKRNTQKDSAFNFNNIEKIGKTFMYHNLTKSKCYNSNFSKSNFDYACFRGAHFKSSFFTECTFVGAEFVGSNLKESKFVGAKFENTVFESVKLEATDFKDAEFKNVIFLTCNMDGVKNLDVSNENIRVFDEMPKVDMSIELQSAVESAMLNKFVKKSRVLDTREGKINDLSVMILLENFDEATLIKGFEKIEDHITRDFFTLSFIIKLINKLLKDGVI